MFMLLQWLSYALAAPGDIAEFGIWREGSALLLTDTCEACGGAKAAVDEFFAREVPNLSI